MLSLYSLLNDLHTLFWIFEHVPGVTRNVLEGFLESLWLVLLINPNSGNIGGLSY